MEDEGVKLLGNSAKLSSIGIKEAIPYIFPALQLRAQVQKFCRMVS